MRTLVVALGLVFVLPAHGAHAQQTGSSFGGGSFGSGGGGTSSSWSSGSSSWGSSSGSGSWGSSSSWSRSSGESGTYGGGSLSGIDLLLIVVGLILVIALRLGSDKAFAHRATPSDEWWEPVAPPAPSPMTRMDVTSISVALDWRARPFVQSRLDALARSGDTRDHASLMKMLASAAELLREVRMAWIYAGVRNAQPMRPQEAERLFRTWTQDARSRYRHELLRNVEGKRSERQAPELRARAEEGQGLVVVTLVVAARRVLPDIHHAEDAARLDRALAGLTRFEPFELVAFEVIWSPSAEADRLSSAELEVLYPELARMAEASMVGRVFCSHCEGPFAAELGACPHCGAPHESIARPERS